jgi:senataxin
MIYKFDLNDSQRDAVISCLGASYCVHKPSVRLIWGPPGTGKTKTVAVMLFYLLLAKKQALVCAPSNMAIMQVASQLVELIEKNHVEIFSFGDIVLFGTKDRMKEVIDTELSKIYLGARMNVLSQCYDETDGVKHHPCLLLQFLQRGTCMENCRKEFNISLEKLASYTSKLLAHLPKSILDEKKIMSLKGLVEELQSLPCPDGQTFDGSLSSVAESYIDRITESYENLVKYPFPNKKKCLGEATLTFCTASMSCQLPPEKKYEILVIDEAANLKECESMIPLKLSGINKLFLAGDDKQLESRVNSQVCLRYKIIHSCSYFTYLLIIYPFCYLLDCSMGYAS